MPEWIAVSRTQHADTHYQPRQDYAFTHDQAVTPILLAELPKLLPLYVLGFIKQEGNYQAVALLSLNGQKNLHLHPDGRWLGSYVPASLRGYPFAMARSEKDAVLVVEKSQLSEDGGEPLFDEEGNLVTAVQQTVDFLQQCEQNRKLTQQAVDAFDQAGVIEPWPLTLKSEGEQHHLAATGLYRISETALNALEGETYTALKGGPMALAHAQMFSMAQISQLGRRAAEQPTTTASEVEENIVPLFREDDDLLFDFDSK